MFSKRFEINSIRLKSHLREARVEFDIKLTFDLLKRPHRVSPESLSKIPFIGPLSSFNSRFPLIFREKFQA